MGQANAVVPYSIGRIFPVISAWNGLRSISERERMEHVEKLNCGIGTGKVIEYIASLISRITL